jgi:hypothetical protein
MGLGAGRGGTPTADPAPSPPPPHHGHRSGGWAARADFLAALAALLGVLVLYTLPGSSTGMAVSFTLLLHRASRSHIGRLARGAAWGWLGFERHPDLATDSLLVLRVESGLFLANADHTRQHVLAQIGDTTRAVLLDARGVRSSTSRPPTCSFSWPATSPAGTSLSPSPLHRSNPRWASPGRGPGWVRGGGLSRRPCSRRCPAPAGDGNRRSLNRDCLSDATLREHSAALIPDG